MVNDLRPIVWSERNHSGQAMTITIQMHLGSIQKPMLTDNQILLPLQAQQMGRSYNARLLLNLDISIRENTTDDNAANVHQADIRDLCVGEIPVLVGSTLCHQSIKAQGNVCGNACYFVVNGQTKVIVSQERLLNNFPLISVCTLQNKQVQYTCEVRSVPASNPNRFPVVFSIRTAIVAPPPTTTGDQLLLDPIIATLTYFRNEVPVMLLFNALGMQDVEQVCELVHRTCHHWADREQLRRLLYSTTQHSAAVRTREDALSVLHRCMQQHVASNQGGAAMRSVPPSGIDGLVAAEELLEPTPLYRKKERGVGPQCQPTAPSHTNPPQDRVSGAYGRNHAEPYVLGQGASNPGVRQRFYGKQTHRRMWHVACSADSKRLVSHARVR
jgi:DNA-directed RNA polymerase beta subunit